VPRARRARAGRRSFRARSAVAQGETPRGGEAGPGASAAPVKTAATDLPLWPREARGIALAAAALLIVGLLIAAAGVPSQSAGGAVAAVEEP